MSGVISLVIPVRNEEKSLPRLLESIRAQTLSPDEVVIVDAGSTDDTRSILEKAARQDSTFTTVRVSSANPGEGRNVGVNRARGNIIAFTDAGIRLDERWLEELTRPLREDSTTAVVYGHYEPIIENFFQSCAALVYVPPQEDTPGGRMRHHFVASMAVRRSVFDQVGGFPPFRAAEDRIFMEHVDSLELNTAWSPHARVHWEIPEDWNATVNRFRTLARHDLVAGRGRDWHFRVYLYWALGILLFPIAPLGYAVRVLKNMWKRADSPSLGLLTPRRVAVCSAVTLATDVGLFQGTWDYLSTDWRRAP